MRRLVGPVLGLLLGGGNGRTGHGPAIGDPSHRARGAPTRSGIPGRHRSVHHFVGFVQKGHVPRVSLKVYNVAALPVATLRIRGRQNVMLDTLALHCGEHVAFWDECDRRRYPCGLTCDLLVAA